MQKAMTTNIARTIAGIATPVGNSGIGIVRISGPEAANISFKLTNKKLLPRQATTLKVLNDTAIAIYFVAPNSFTGEDTVELQCHGGHFLLQKVLEDVLSLGAFPALPGEFSRQAFLNGKLSLDQAEAIIDIINAESEMQLNNAHSLFNGKLRVVIEDIEKSLITVSAQLEAAMDYPDDVEVVNVAPQLEVIIKQIGELVDTARTGRILSNGIHVAVLGKPNVGKSSIFNALLNTDRSIITDTPGTTTDTISESIQYNGIKITFHDTAGIRDGQNKIESMGIERSKRALCDCDVVLIVFDSTNKDNTKEETELLALSKNKPYIVVYNKSDLEEKKGVFTVSAKTGHNIDEIKKQIFNKVISTPITTNQIVITNARHLVELRNSCEALSSALQALSCATVDCVASDISTALQHIGNITGTRASEAVLDEIFSRFCLGK